MTRATLRAAILAAFCLTLTNGHGRLLEPVSRMSAWRLGFPTPKNYYDHGMNCGSFEVMVCAGHGKELSSYSMNSLLGDYCHAVTVSSFGHVWGTIVISCLVQWKNNGGKCGICGDSWSGPRYYERPSGLMVKHDVIPTQYQDSDVIKATVELTKAHMGWSEFRICDVAKSGGIEATQECLNKTLLADRSGRSRFFFTTNKEGLYNYELVLPRGLTCSHCVFQWKWKVGNSWGCDDAGCGLGRGVVQEEFYGCSDVTIVPRGTNMVTGSRPTTPRKSTTVRTAQMTTKSPIYTKTSTTRRPAGTTKRSVWTTRSPNYYQAVLDIIRRYNLSQRTFDSAGDDDTELNLDDELPQEISGQDFLKMLLNQQDVNKLPFIYT